MNNSRRRCVGTVHALRGQVAMATGKVFIRGERVDRDTVHLLLSRAGARVTTKMSGQISLLIHGDLSAQVVVDLARAYSQKILGVLTEDASGHHVCVVSSLGLSELLEGRTAPCMHHHIVRRT